MRENTAITCQGQSGLIQLGLYGYLRIIYQRLANVLVVDLVFLRNAQRSYDRSARDLRHLTERFVMVVLGRAKIRLARCQPSLNLPV